MGSVFYNPQTLHGKRVKLNRGGESVEGILSAKNLKDEEGGFNFKWTTKAGSTCISDVTDEELALIKKENQEEEVEEED